MDYYLSVSHSAFIITLVNTILLFNSRYIHDLAGPLQNPRLCIAYESPSRYYFQVFYKVVEEGEYKGPSDIKIYLEQLLPSSRFVLCPGLKDYPEQIRFKTKHLVEWGLPFCRKFSDRCSLWYVPKKDTECKCCPACKLLQHDIKVLAQRADKITDSQRRARTLPSSKYPLSKLSPASQKKRTTSTMVERKNLIRKVNKLQPFNCTVSDKQNDELLQLVTSVSKKGSKVIQELIDEGDKALGENNVLKESWQQDVIERLQFDSDQHKTGGYIACYLILSTK